MPSSCMVFALSLYNLCSRILLYLRMRTATVPPIELVTLQKLSGSQQRQAGKRPHNVLQYKLTRNGQEIPLTLSQNADFLSPGRCYWPASCENGPSDSSHSVDLDRSLYNVENIYIYT